MVTMHDDRKIVIDDLAFGEGPRWHEGSLYLSDMHHNRVLRIDGEGTAHVTAQHDGALSGLGWLPDGTLLVVEMEGAVLRLDEDGLSVYADLKVQAHFGVNDMIVHPAGWAYVGQFGYDREGGGTVVASPLLKVGVDGSVSQAAADLMVANGMIITPDGGTLLVAESAGCRLSAFTIGNDGELKDRRVWATMPDRHYPDGMCLDAEGGVWVGCPMVNRFVRVLEGGEVTDEINLEPDRHAIACVLGGIDRRTLYMLNAVTTGQAERSRELRSAHLESAEVDVPGAGLP
jgi:sugar lactone lactonase YvrE